MFKPNLKANNDLRPVVSASSKGSQQNTSRDGNMWEKIQNQVNAFAEHQQLDPTNHGNKAQTMPILTDALQ